MTLTELKKRIDEFTMQYGRPPTRLALPPKEFEAVLIEAKEMIPYVKHADETKAEMLERWRAERSLSGYQEFAFNGIPIEQM